MLKQRALAATLWSGGDIFLRQGLQFVVSIALARLLSPEEFGTVALLSLFVGVANAFVDSGLSRAIVRSQDVTHTDESTVFWFNLAVAAAVALLLCAAAPAIARFFAHPVLVPLTAVMALNIFLSALGAIHGTLLTKRLEFRTLMKVGAIALVTSGVVAIVMARRGYGVWALAAQTLTATAVTTAMLWVFNDWRPALIFSVASARKLLGFGGYLLVAGLLDVAYNRVYTLLIGKLYGVRELGFYNRADGTSQLPSGILGSVLARVAFPIFSAAAHDTDQLRRGLRLAVRGIMLINAPMMLGLAAVAEALVLALFGPRWLPAVPVLRILSLGGVLWPLHVINLNVLVAQGHSRLFFRIEVIKKVLGVGFLAVGSLYGITGMAWSQVAFSAVAFGINSFYSEHFLKYGTWDQIKDIAPVVGIAALMALGVTWLDAQLHFAPLLRLITLAGGGAVTYAALGLVCRLAAFHDAIDLVRRRGKAAPIGGVA